METLTGGVTVVSYPSQSIQLTMFLEPRILQHILVSLLEPNTEGCLRLPNIGVVGVVVTRDVVDGAAQFIFVGFVLMVYEH